jgi:hypothetical protein
MIKSERNKSGVLCYWDDVLNASKVKSPKEPPEQKNLNSHCSKLWPDLSKMMWHVINESGGSGDAQYGSSLNRLGRKKGVPDWHVMIPSNGYHGLYVELKRSRKVDSSTSKEQKDFLLMAESLGYKCVIAYGYKAALKSIEKYLK